MTQTIIVEQDKHDCDRIMITVREANGFGHTVRIEKACIPQLITDLSNQLSLTWINTETGE